jgi:hypothetical protein
MTNAYTPWALELGRYVQVVPRSADSLDILTSCETCTAPTGKDQNQSSSIA